MGGPVILPIILAILLPPLAVFLRSGLGRLFWIDLVLTIFAWLPGAIYALVLVARSPSRTPVAS
jgi:uncharacterized membrane protein YqaE (UPF0057 family)